MRILFSRLLTSPSRITPMTGVLVGLSLMTAPAAYAATSAQTPVKEWTVLVYLNGKNNLDSFGTADLLEMQKVGSTDDVNIVVDWGSMNGGTNKRLFIEKDPDATTVTAPVIKDMGSVDMGDWQYLRDFITWGAANYPAKKYAISIWNHGSGWHRLNLLHKGGRFQINDISFDDETGHAITTVQLGQALREASKTMGQKLDLVGADACLMAMIEVVGEFADAVKHFAGSQELEPGMGWAYDLTLGHLVEKPSMDSAELGKVLTADYLNSYMTGTQGTEEVTLSVLDLSKYSAFTEAFKTLATQIGGLGLAESQAWVNAAAQAQSFSNSEYVDFGDFSRLVKGAAISNVRIDTLDAATQALDSLVIANATTASYARATGVSFHLPLNLYTYEQYAPLYRGLQFDHATGWGDALGKVLTTAESAPTP